MRRYLRLTALGFVVIVGAVALRAFAAGSPTADTLPLRLTDQEFWAFTEQMSEPNGYFRSDNFLSNERAYQTVIPELVRLATPGRVYLGVGPEQNFPYIVALKPKMAIIFDIRRGNLHLQLLYKALFEMSDNRVEFLSRLWSRRAPAWLNTQSSVDELMSAYRQVPPAPEAYTANFQAVSAWLTEKHQFALRSDDLEGIDYVYRTAFYEGGPDLTYSMQSFGGSGNGRGRMPSTYADIQMLTDGAGKNRGFLATEDNWRVMKDLETENMVVPVVGDFGGPSAIRSVGKYLASHGTTVSAFYLSNVEQYLNQDGKEDEFLCNVATLPLDESSTFIYTGAGRFGRRGGGGGGGFGGGLSTTFLRPILPDTRQCTSPLARLWH